MYTIIASPLGPIRIEAQNGAIEQVLFTDEELMPTEDKLLQEAQKQLQEYFAGERKAFDLPLRMQGTPFQLAAWRVLQGIPYGETITYGQEAERMGNRKAARAAGGANHQNRLSILVPCHRVVAATGMGGYGWGTEKKKFLLEMEEKNSK